MCDRKILQQNSKQIKRHSEIFVRLRYVVTDSIYEPLETIFRQALVTGVFPSEWKKVTLFLSAKKVTSKISKIIVQFLSFQFVAKSLKDQFFKDFEMFKFFTSNNLISPNQSRFKPGDSCINQLLTITQEIYKLFDDGLEVRGAFQTYPKLSIKSGMRDLFSN